MLNSWYNLIGLHVTNPTGMYVFTVITVLWYIWLGYNLKTMSGLQPRLSLCITGTLLYIILFWDSFHIISWPRYIIFCTIFISIACLCGSIMMKNFYTQLTNLKEENSSSS